MAGRQAVMCNESMTAYGGGMLAMARAACALPHPSVHFSGALLPTWTSMLARHVRRMSGLNGLMLVSSGARRRKTCGRLMLVRTAAR